MYGCIGRGRKERDRGGIAPALDALPQVALGYEDMPVASYRTFPSCPCLGKEPLALEVLVELIADLHSDITQNMSDHYR